jgi:hypothetical protein
MVLAIVCAPSAKREMERKNLTTVQLGFPGYSENQQFVANYSYGKQKRTKTRKEETEARKA